MGDELRRLWKEVGTAFRTVLSDHLPGKTDKNHETYWYSRYLGRFEPV